uniref:Protein wings apart-like n=1 Tax=Cacopsylla melanoneura TaxID=428564 RepID=A0A8D8L725_9HEMI
MSAKTGKQTYGRGKYSYNPSSLNSNIQFDNLLCENKPSAAKSAGTIGKWGVVSYTSIRSASTGSKFTVGKRNNTNNNNTGAPASKKPSTLKSDPFSASPKKNAPPPPSIQRPKKFFKSRSEPEPLAPLPPRPNPVANQLSPRFTPEKKAPEKKKLPSKSKKSNSSTSSKRRKTYSSSEEEIDENEEEDEIYEDDDSQMDEIVVQQQTESSTSPAKRDKPPIVLRIFKGNSSHDFKAVTVETTVDDEEDEDQDEDEEEQEEDYEAEPEPYVAPTVKSYAPAPMAPEPALLPEEALFLEEDDIDENDDEDEFKPGGKGRKGKKGKGGATGKKKKPPVRAPTPPSLSNPAPLPRSSRLRERALRNSGSTSTQPDPSDLYPETDLPSSNLSNLREEDEENIDDTHEQDLRQLNQDADRLLNETTVNFDQITNKITIRKPKAVPIQKPSVDKDRECLLKVLESDDDEDEEDQDQETTPSESENATSELSDPPQEQTAETVPDIPSQEEPPPEPKVPPLSLKIPPLIISKNFKHVAEAEWCSDSDGSDSAQGPPEPDVETESVSNSQEVPTSTTSSQPESMVSEVELGSSQSFSQEPVNSQESVSSTKSYQSRKGSIFKSRAASGGQTKKRLALYKHKWVDEKQDPLAGNKDKLDPKAGAGHETVETVDEAIVNDLKRVTRQTGSMDKFDEEEEEDVTGVTCPKKAKKFYTVIKNVKKVHQLQESGEFQEFNDDVEYILDALQQSNPIGTRCLSAITLASKCMAPDFRMHLRAHGTVAKFFKALQDAAKDQSLGMCTATVMFVLSQDRLNMDVDRDCLELMLNLLESDTSHKNALDHCGLSDTQLHKTRTRVRELCAEIQSQGHAKHLNLDNITVGHLAMETLLSLTSKRAGEWFKEELRELGGLEHIILTIVDCCKLVDDTVNAWSPALLEKIRKVDRCLRVLENVTFQNEENKSYLLKYKEGILGETLCRLYKVCDYEIPLYPTSNMADKDSTGAILRECLLANLKVLINLTHDFKDAPPTSSLLGGKFSIVESSLHILLQIPQHIPEEERFDLSVLSLLLLINLVESNAHNRAALINAKAPSDTENIFGANPDEMAVDALVKLFYSKKSLAAFEENKTDKLLDGENVEKPSKDAPKKVHEEFIEETVAMLLQKAGRHMEHTFIAAYVAVLLGYLILDNKHHDIQVRQYLPEHNFQDMISVLDKYVKFMNLTMASSAEGIRGLKATEMIIKAMNKSDEEMIAAQQQAQAEEAPENLSASYCEDRALDMHISPS